VRTKAEYQAFVQSQLNLFTIKPKLVVYLIGEDPASIKYVTMKQRLALNLGIQVIVRHYRVPVLNGIKVDLQKDVEDTSINGIIIQLPLKNEYVSLLDLIPANKDVDLLNLGNQGSGTILQPTVQAIMLVINDLLHPQSDFESKLKVKSNFEGLLNYHFAVIGQGKLVGKPVASFLQSLGCQVTIIDIDTPNPKSLSSQADIIISGAGSPGLIDATWLKPGAIVIDASTSNDNGQLVGDINLQSNFDASATIVPSPGGIGPLTVYSLFYNLIVLSQLANKKV
jgi:methylenetetrahydrofolate dehydrogenase (NADP+) / methenyltetrahydrofolate cyclohydrolase